MSLTARRIASVPARTSSATWAAIVDLLAPNRGAARDVLTAVTGVASIAVAEEYTRSAPIVVVPVRGPRVRVYTVHGADAADALLEETVLLSDPTVEPGWTLCLPCAADDLDELRAGLSAYPQLQVRELSELVPGGADIPVPSSPVTVNLTELEA